MGVGMSRGVWEVWEVEVDRECVKCGGMGRGVYMWGWG